VELAAADGGKAEGELREAPVEDHDFAFTMETV
jgi:hypothetical protein